MIKLGPHLLPGGEAETLDWLKLVPTVAKFCYTFDAAQSANPLTLCLGRPDEAFLGSPAAPLGEGDPAVVARRMVNQVYAPLIAAYPAIDAWEGPNEIGIGVDQTDLMRWYTALLAELGRGLYGLGSRAVLGAWAVGNPEPELWRFYGPVLRACLPASRGGYNAILSRHSYGTLDQWCAYRHTLDEREYQRQGFENTPVILSECGGDYIKNRAGDIVFKPWRREFNGDLAAYWVKYLCPFVLELNKAPYVLGATLFTVGDGFSKAWHDFDVADHNGPGLVEIMKIDPPEPAPPQPEKERITVTTETTTPEITVVTTLAGDQATVDKVLPKVYQFHRDLGVGIAQPAPFTAVSRSPAAHWLIAFAAPNISPTPIHAIWDISVVETFTDTDGTVWWRVNPAGKPAMWILADQAMVK